MKTKRKLAIALCGLILVMSLFAGCANTQEAEAPAPPEDGAPSESAEGVPTETGEEGEISQEKLDTTLYLGYSDKTLTNPFIVSSIEAMDKFCAYLDSIGQKYEKQTLMCEGSEDQQVADVQAFAAKAAGNGILTVNASTAGIVPTIVETCEEAEVYLVTIWSKPDDISPMDYEYWAAHTAPDDTGQAYNTMVALCEEIGGAGNIMIIHGQMGNTASIDRDAGIVKALEEFPDIVVLDEQTADWDTTNAMNITETWLNAYDDIDGIWCACDSIVTGALQALDTKGLKGKTKIVGFDGNQDVIEEIVNGNVLATVSANPYMQGAYSFAVSYKIWSGQVDIATLAEEYRDYFTKSILITAENAQEYLDTYLYGDPGYDYSDAWFCRDV